MENLETNGSDANAQIQALVRQVEALTAALKAKEAEEIGIVFRGDDTPDAWLESNGEMLNQIMVKGKNTVTDGHRNSHPKDSSEFTDSKTRPSYTDENGYEFRIRVLVERVYPNAE